MRTIKTQGGLTRGKGMSETQRLIWVLSMPACASINEAMQKFCGTTFQTSEQHKDVSLARETRDVSDTLELITYLKDRDPFVQNSDLFNIANVMTAQQGVNVEKAKAIGEKIVKSMEGKSTEEFIFHKADQAVTLGSRFTIKIKGESVKVDPQLMFQRLITIGDFHEGDLQELLKYELCSYPPSIFASNYLPLMASKSTLADALWKIIKCTQRRPCGKVQYILDGGALLHCLPWPRGSTFENIRQMYVTYVTQKYGNAVIVFDGYSENQTTKHEKNKGMFWSNCTFYWRNGNSVQEGRLPN